MQAETMTEFAPIPPSRFDRWLAKASRNKRTRNFWRWLTAFGVTMFCGISSGTMWILFDMGGTGIGGLSTLGVGGEALGSLVFIQIMGCLITVTPTIIYAVFCAAVSARLRMIGSLLCCLVMALLIWAVVLGGNFSELSDPFTQGLFVVSLFSGSLGMAATRGMHVMMMKRLELEAVLKEIEADARQGVEA